MREGELLRHIIARSADLERTFKNVLVGPGDDCAVIAVGPPDGTPAILLKVDQLVQDRHFVLPATPIDLIARKAIARTVSDIAASGGRPTAALAAAVIPSTFTGANQLFDEMARWARHFGCPLVGGDISSLSSGQAGPLALSVTVIGEPHPSRGPVLRSGARPGDAVYVTGALGASLDRASGRGRHLTFEPRLAEARWLCDTLGKRLHAMMDISDGVGKDASRLAHASGVRVMIDGHALPLAAGADTWRHAAGDGEDYELLFTAPAMAFVPPVCPETGTPVTRIGRVEEAVSGAPECVITADGIDHDGEHLGWEH